MRIIQVLQYLRARSLPATRALTTRYATGFGAAALVWVASAVVDVPERYWLWGAALAVDFATPWFAAQHGRRFPPDAALIWAVPVRLPRVVLAVSLLAAVGAQALAASRWQRASRNNQATAGH